MRDQRVPAKWRKYQLLIDLGLLDETDLRSMLTRYGVSCWAALERDLLTSLREDARSRRRTLYVVILVDPLRVGQLPNWRLVKSEDITGTIRSIKSHFVMRRATEVWVTRTPMDATVSVAGRLTWGETGQRHEMVWRVSPRLIERIGVVAVPYVRAWRPSWGWRFGAVEADTVGRLSRQELMKCFSAASACLARSEERLQRLGSVIARCGISEVSVEYKLVGERFSVIDWDTADDHVVLNHVENGLYLL